MSTRTTEARCGGGKGSGEAQRHRGAAGAVRGRVRRLVRHRFADPAPRAEGVDRGVARDPEQPGFGLLDRRGPPISERAARWETPPEVARLRVGQVDSYFSPTPEV